MVQVYLVGDCSMVRLSGDHHAIHPHQENLPLLISTIHATACPITANLD